MKKMLLMAVATAFSVMAMAQVSKSDQARMEKTIELSDIDIAHPKRTTRAYVWLDRAKALYEAYTAPVKILYDGQTETHIVNAYGKGTELGVQDVGIHSGLRAVEYPDFIVYYNKVGDEYKVVYWQQKLFIKGASLEGAVEAYLKAAELDNSKATREDIREALENEVYNRYVALANSAQDEGDNVKAADMCLEAYKISALPVLNKPNTKMLYNAGYLYALSGEYDKGAKYLQEAADLGETSDGDTYYYIAYSYNNMEEPEKAMLALETGAQKFPDNMRIVEMLAAIYANSENPEDHLEFVKNAAMKLNKGELWNAVGLVYDKMGDVEKAIESFEKALSYSPNDHATNFNVGLMLVKVGLDKTKEVNEMEFSSQKEYDAALNEAIVYYVRALPFLERAIEIAPNELNYIEFTRDLLVNMRDRDPKYKEKYNKYDQMARALDPEGYNKD